MKKITAIILLSVALSASLTAASITGRFRSITMPSGRMTSVFSIEQSADGFVWMGTDDGLVRYDGYSFRSYRWEMGDSLSLANNLVNALLYDGLKDCLYVGTDAGVSVYNPLKDSFQVLPGTEDRHAKAFLIDGEHLYVGTTTGLLRVGDGRTETVADDHFTNVRKIGDDIWAASYNAIYRIGCEGDVSRFDLSGYMPAGKTLVLDICQDAADPSALWIGSESGLFHYIPSLGKVDDIRWRNIPVKTFRYIDDDLWIGSDNGLIIKEADGSENLYRHKADHVSSIPNDVVWCVFEDSAGSIWIGTDHGAASVEDGEAFRYVGLEGFTVEDDGLDVGVIETDGRGNFWLGGHNGLICADPDMEDGFWFKADSGKEGKRLSHNKVRDLYDDGSTMWIVSDGGLDAFSHSSGRISKYMVTETTGRFSSNWMYSIAEDSHGRLWIGTYDGGLYGVDKGRLLSSGGKVECDIHFNIESDPPLPSNIVRNIAIYDDILYAETGNIINTIRLDTWEVTRTRMPYDVFVVSILPDAEGLWVGTDKGLYRMDGEGVLTKISGADVYVMSMTFHEGRLWMACRSSLSSYAPGDGSWTHVPSGEVPLVSVKAVGEKLYFGTIDGILEYSPSVPVSGMSDGRIVLTEMYLNDVVVEVGRKYDGRVILDRNVKDVGSIVLSPHQNSFSFALSSFTFGRTEGHMMYRLRGFDDRWRRLYGQDNKASFINVPSGKYVFEFACENPSVEVPVDVCSLELQILALWYATPFAYALYMIVFIGLCVAVFYYWRMRHELAMEHKERERAIAMADSKTEFLANISHEFKSPLSIILDFISRMTSSESDALRTRELMTVQKNAEKMHLLLNQMVEFNENGSLSLFMPTAVSIGALAKDVWSGYVQAFAEKDISARFVSEDIDYLFMVDKVLMESVFSNLLSNALKFTPCGGSILMSVAVSKENSDMIYVDVKVNDTGCGIEESELPKIFNRYYMAPSGKCSNSGGSGIGLDIVKNIVEMHKGKIFVESVPGKGSCFTVRLSTMKSDSFILRSAVETDVSLRSLSQVWRHERKPIILVVEDNHDIRDFIIASLGKDYVFLTADNGHQGLELLGSEKVDLVITDISMPEMDGLAMSRMMRNNISTAFLPIIVLTGKSDMQTQIQSFEYADAFITKPFDLNYLNGMIIKLLIKHEQYLSKMRQQKMLKPQAEEVESPDERFLREVTEIVGRHMDDLDFSVSVLCSESHWSDKQVYRKIKQLTGKTVTEFIRDIRLEKAAGYLAQGKLTVNEVMYKVGFTTASYFSKCFKDKFGVSPSDYHPS